MDVKLIELSKQPNRKLLIEFLQEQSLEDIAATLESQLRPSPYDDVDPLLVIRAILLGSPAQGDERCMQRRMLVFNTAISWLSGGDSSFPSSTQHKLATNLINLLSPEIEVLPPSMLFEAGMTMGQHLENREPVNPRLFDLLSKTVNILSAAEAFEESNAIIKRIQTVKWHPQSAVSLASALNDMELSSTHLESMVKRMIQQLAQLDFEETPPYVYQLLLLSRKGCKRLILSGICEYLGQNMEDSPSRSRMEGTIMLHMSFALKQDQELGNELVKYMRSGKTYLSSTFHMTCLLSAARIHRLEDAVFDMLKSSITAIYKDAEKLKKCAWIAEYADIDPQRLHRVMLHVVQKSAQGWDQVIQPMTQLAILLIDSATSQGSWLKTSATKPPRQKRQGPMDMVVALSTDILLHMFQLHDIVRAEVLEQITSRIVSRSASATEFLQLLESIILTCPLAVEPYIANIKDTLDYLSLLPFSISECLLEAIQPITMKNAQFRDGLMLVLRKSMFAKDVNGRKVAVSGFLKILRDQVKRTQEPLQDQGNSSWLDSAQNQVFEILGLLRRCFSQQAEVRTIAYNGLGVQTRRCPNLAADTFEIMNPQFLKVYVADTALTVPLRLDQCVENALSGGYPKLTEPVDVLLVHMLHAMRHLSQEECNPVIAEVYRKCSDAVASLTFRLSKADLEDYELDKAASMDMATHVGLRNVIYAQLLLGSYEAAIEHEFFAHGDSFESFDLMLNLFKKRKALNAILKENTTNEKGRKVSTAMHTCVLSLEFMAKITRCMFIQGQLQMPARALRSDIDFVHFIVLNTPTALKTAIELDPRGRDDEANFGYCIELCKVYIQILITEDTDSSFVSHQPKKGQSVLGSVIEGIRYILETVFQIWPQRMASLMRHLLAAASQTVVPQDADYNKVVSDTFSYFKDMATKYLAERTQLYKETTGIVQVMALLAQHLDRGTSTFKEGTERIVQWLDAFAKERPIEDVALAREITALHIRLCAEIEDFITITYLAQDAHTLRGDLDVPFDSQDEVEIPPIQYMMVNPKTCDAITSQLLAFLDQSFEDLMWCIGRLKLSAAVAEEGAMLVFEQRICKRTLALLSIMSELTKAILTGIHAENLIKVLTKAYKALTALVKYQLQKLTRAQHLSQDFISVIAMAGTGVTDKMYKFLTIYGQHDKFDPAPEGRKKGKKSGTVNTKEKAKILRESKMIPNLIFVVEQFERHLIQLTRKSRVDLMQYMKRSTARDFKIKLEYIQGQDNSDDETMKEKLAAADQGDGEEEQDQDQDNEEEEENEDEEEDEDPDEEMGEASDAEDQHRHKRRR